MFAWAVVLRRLAEFSRSSQACCSLRGRAWRASRRLPVVELGRLRGARPRPGPLVGIALGYLVAASAGMICRGLPGSPASLVQLMVPVPPAGGGFLGVRAHR